MYDPSAVVLPDGPDDFRQGRGCVDGCGESGAGRFQGNAAGSVVLAAGGGCRPCRKCLPRIGSASPWMLLSCSACRRPGWLRPRKRTGAPSPGALAYTLTGLPPEERVLAEFCQDESPGAYERLVDTSWPRRILESTGPGCGWIRCATATAMVTIGMNSGPPPGVTADYVVRAFQQDKPFDRFIREQLAGDELVEGARQMRPRRIVSLPPGFSAWDRRTTPPNCLGRNTARRAAIEADLAETDRHRFSGHDPALLPLP